MKIFSRNKLKYTFKNVSVCLINYSIIFVLLYLISGAYISFLAITITIITIIGTSIETLQIKTTTNTRYYDDKKSKQILTITESFMFAMSVRIISRQSIHVEYIASGILMLILGLFIRIHSIRQLGCNFHSTVSITRKNTLIVSGIYKYIRHPCYLGVLVLSFGYVISSGFTIITLVAFISVIIAILYRINVEEKFLIKSYGMHYSNYINNTKKIIPYIY